jgi:hypothetical protein
MKSYRKARKRHSAAAVDETANLPTRERPGDLDEDNGAPLVDNVAHSDPVEAGPSNTMRASQHVENLLRKKKANKENVPRPHQPTPRKKSFMFNEPQEDAGRVEWDEDTQDPREAQERPVIGSKRAQDDEVSEDDGFQNDTRPVEVVRRRKGASSSHIAEPVASRPSPKRQRVEQSERPESDNHRPSREAEPESDEDGDKRRMVRYQQSTARSIQGVARARPRQPQTRTPWTEEEVLALIEYIEDIGTSWTNIKKTDESWNEGSETYEGPQYLKRRDQVALKDKARNLKVDFLK